MKVFCILTAGVLALTAGCSTTVRSDDSQVSAAASLVISTPPSDDAGADLVAAFYGVLLQRDPPTMAQEKALFLPTPTLRDRLVIAGEGKAKDAVVLDYFRKHKDLFLPQPLRSNYVVISSSYHFVRNLDGVKNPPPEGSFYVSVWICEDQNAKPGKAQFRTIVFSFDDGKIDPSEIWLEGMGNKPSLGVFPALDENGSPLKEQNK